MGVGVYGERAVSPALRKHFASVWFHRAPRGASGKSAIVPDGSADLLWFNGMLQVAGPDQQVKFESVPAGMTVVGLRFQPGSALQWLKTSVSEIVDSRISLECFWGAEARRQAEWIGDGTTPEDLARRLELTLSRRLPDVAEPDVLYQTIFHTVNRRRDYSIPVIRQLSESLHLSERTVRRRCYESFGYGPKTLDRILRFQRFLALTRAPGARMTADLAADVGYSDQSHLTREARYLAGLTPTQIRQQLA
jgi:AraC-like DNA-binding protein